MTQRHFKVAGIPFRIELEEPWKFMEYTSSVKARIEAGASGEVITANPVRAGDKLPSRTYVTCKKELPQDMDMHTFDFSQFEVFGIPEGESEDDFSICISSSKPEWIGTMHQDGSAKYISEQNSKNYSVNVLKREHLTIYEIKKVAEKEHFTLTIDLKDRRAIIYPVEGLNPYAAMCEISSISMLAFSIFASSHSALVIHASVIMHNGAANLFFGKSGTGKSTHARLWKENIPDCELINDDNPVIRMEDGKPYVYGSPWSGKTPCYRNVKANVRAMVKLFQAPYNNIRKARSIEGYSELLSSSTLTRWEKELMNKVSSTLSGFAESVPFWKLECLPNPDAAKLCFNEIEGNN